MNRNWSRKDRHTRRKIKGIIDKIEFATKDMPIILEVVACGSYRRQFDYCGDLNMLFKLSNIDKVGDVIPILINKIGPDEILTHGKKKSNILINKVQIDLNFSSVESWPYALLHHTGSVEESIRLRKVAKNKNLKLNEKGLYNENDELIKLSSERDIYNYLGIEYRSPENR